MNLLESAPVPMKMDTHVPITQWPVEERPYEKASRRGIETLSDAELLSMVIRTGTRSQTALDVAYRVLRHDEEYPGILGLCHMTPDKLMEISGIGAAKAYELKAIAELSKRIATTKCRERISLNSPESIADLYMEELRHESREKLIAIFFDGRNKMIKDMLISQGTVNHSVASPREIYVEALKAGAVSLVLVHNHPSGDPTPSMEDMEISRIIKEAGCYIGIKLLDHIIIGDCCYISFQEQNLLD